MPLVLCGYFIASNIRVLCFFIAISLVVVLEAKLVLHFLKLEIGGFERAIIVVLLPSNLTTPAKLLNASQYFCCTFPIGKEGVLFIRSPPYMLGDPF